MNSAGLIAKHENFINKANAFEFYLIFWFGVIVLLISTLMLAYQETSATLFFSLISISLLVSATYQRYRWRRDRGDFGRDIMVVKLSDHLQELYDKNTFLEDMVQSDELREELGEDFYKKLDRMAAELPPK